MEIILLIFATLVGTLISFFVLRWVLDISTIIKNQEQTNKYLKELCEQNNEILRKLRQ